MKQTVAVLFGGCSSEHEISRLSAATILRNLSPEAYDTMAVGITKSGRWFLTPASPESIENGSWENDPGNRQAFLSPDRGVHGLVLPQESGAAACLRVDVVIPALHGKNGEDGTVQGLLQLADIPYVGCATLACAVCMDKAVSHTLLAAAGIGQAKYLWFYASDYESQADQVRERIVSELGGYPVFVKPANAGSSVGVSKVARAEELDGAVAKAAHEDWRVVIEEFVDGQEVECAVLGNEKPEAALVGEIGASAEFYDYDDKYISGTSQLFIPARLSPETAEEVRRTACRAYRLLGCEGLARVDFFVRGGSEVILNELNTLPGFTSISMYPKLWEACGLPCTALLDRLIALAMER